MVAVRRIALHKKGFKIDILLREYFRIKHTEEKLIKKIKKVLNRKIHNGKITH